MESRLKQVWWLMAVLMVGSVAAPPSEGQTLLDWIRARRMARRAMLPPGVTAYSVPVGVTTANVCTTQTVVGYRPEVQYQTAYYRIPVTQYRPETTVDPVTGASVTAMRPCTTFTWQTRRVPYTVMRPVVSAVTACRPTIVSAPVNCGCPVPVAAPAAAVPASPASPYYAPSGVPASPGGMVPGAVMPGGTAPGSVLQPPGNGTPGSMPADQRPDLTDPMQRMPQGQGGENGQGPGAANSSFRSPDSLVPVPARPPESRLRPIPAPAGEAEPEIEGPQLFNPRDRMATQAASTWAVTPIRWEVPARPATWETPAEPRDESSAAGSAHDPRYDASGWRSVRP